MRVASLTDRAPTREEDKRSAGTSIAAAGEPEDQLRAPFEQLLLDIAQLARIPRSKVVAVGESTRNDLKTRPD
jgi:hypothetical protein